jgi:hypothetical protein
VAWRSSAAVGYRAIREWGQETNCHFDLVIPNLVWIVLRCYSVSSYARAGYEGRLLLLLLFVFGVTWIHCFDCLWYQRWEMGQFSFWEICVTLSTYGLKYYLFLIHMSD